MKSPSIRIPGATYRLQFNRDFTFQDARSLVAYLHDLGVTDIYASPVFVAPPDSNHGYDVCDYNRFNPVLGSERDWSELTKELRERGMGLLLDFVPNHMGASPNFNSWWRDVLEYGRESPYAEFFDVDWNSSEPLSNNRVLLPILEDHYGRVLNQRLFRLALAEGRLQIQYHDILLPLHPRSYRRVLEKISESEGGDNGRVLSEFLLHTPPEASSNRAAFENWKQNLRDKKIGKAVGVALEKYHGDVDPEFIDQLLEEQVYQLGYWRSASRVANYRRFFDVDTLIGLNMDRPEVFRAAHRLLGECIRSGNVTGVRLDHIDGLADPSAYLNALQRFLAEQCEIEIREDGRAFYIIVEKITMDGEELPTEWPVFGTTGYEFGAIVNAVLMDGAQETAFTKIYGAFVSTHADFDECVRRSKLFVMAHGLKKEISELSRLLTDCAREQRETRDLSPDDLHLSIAATMACFPVYRTYVVENAPVTPRDRATVENAIRQARLERPDADSLAFDFLQSILLCTEQASFSPNQALFRKRFQQFSGPIMAKSYEDTAFFVFNRMIALNEVGGNPACFGVEPLAFHELNLRRLALCPHGMITTSTHDTKLSEDARARVAALSQCSKRWESFLAHARGANLGFKKFVRGAAAPDVNEEYRFYQALLATWPLEELTDESRKIYITRLQQHMLKSVREAKVNTRWDAPDKEWEEATNEFVERVIAKLSPEFNAHFLPLAGMVAELGMINSLSQTLLKLTAPGVPDIYQGNELWQFVLTDPDNRRPIDFALRQKILASIDQQTPSALLKKWRSGAIKMFLTRAVLNFRRMHREVFEHGNFVPLQFAGEYQCSCVGFARSIEGQLALVLAPRLTMQIGFPPIGELWKNTSVDLGEFGARPLRNLFTGKTVRGADLPLSEAFWELPFAMFVSDGI